MVGNQHYWPRSLCGVTMAPVTLPAHHPARPPVVSQQEAGEDGRARWWAGRGRGHCGRQCAIMLLPMQETDARCTAQASSTRGEGGRGGGGDKPSQTAEPTETTTKQKPQKSETQTPTNSEPKQAIWPTERTKTQQKTKHRKNPGGRSHAVYRKSMLRSNASEMIVKSSVVPKTKNRETKKQKKQPATAVVEVSRTAEKNKSSHSLRSHPEEREKEIRRGPNPRNNI